MDKIDLTEILQNKEILKIYRRNECELLKQNHPEFEKFLIAKQPWLITDNLEERIYVLLNKIKSPPVCQECGKPTEFYRYNVGYKKHCSQKCARKAKKIKDIRNWIIKNKLQNEFKFEEEKKIEEQPKEEIEQETKKDQ